MAEKILYLIPDTNLFIQCRPLQEIDWSACLDFANFDEIHLIVCNPVHREIDNLKNRGNDRVGRRARKTSSIFRQIITTETGYQEITQMGPKIKLVVGSNVRPSPELNDRVRLDYNKPDDEVVGCLHRFLEECPGVDARLLTHDGGPMVTAKSLGLPFVPIPDTWLLPPESNVLEKENQKLREDVLRLRKAEPDFEVKLIDNEGNEINSLNVRWRIYEPLTEDDVAELVDLLRSRFPMVLDFNQTQRSNLDVPSIGLLLNAFSSYPSEREIERYKLEEYPSWLEKCENILSDLHNRLAELNAPSFCVLATNKGIRPGKDALIDITAKGPFKIRPPSVKEEDEDYSINLPLPPKAPERQSIMGSLAIPHGLLGESLYTLQPSSNGQRDANRFYYKPGRPDTPAESFSLECEQWRHGTYEEEFEGRVFFDSKLGQMSGALECDIQAENLSDPLRKEFHVKFMAETVDTKYEARNFVNRVKMSIRRSA